MMRVPVARIIVIDDDPEIARSKLTDASISASRSDADARCSDHPRYGAQNSAARQTSARV
jgi:hypothetical protein